MRMTVPVVAAAIFGCLSSTDQGAAHPAGLFWGSGASAAFVADTVSLVVFYADSAGRPIGAPRPVVTWQSSDSTVVRILTDTLALAVDTGLATLTARTRRGTAFNLSQSIAVVAPLDGRMVWVRQLPEGGGLRLARREFPRGDVVPFPPFGGEGDAHGRVSVAQDRRRAVSYGARPPSAVADQALYLLDLETGTSRILLDTMLGHQIWPLWLPGDTLIAFLANRSGAWEVWTVRPDGTGAQRRTNLRSPYPPFFGATPDGNLVLTLYEPNGASDLWELTLAGDTVRRLTQSPNYEGSPAVSPDGNTIAYVAGTVDVPALGSLGQVWLADRDGSNRRRLVAAHGVVVIPDLTPSITVASTSSPSWSSDGAYVLVAWNVDPALLHDGFSYYATLGEIYAVRVSDGRAIRLTRWPLIDAQAALR